MLSREGFQCLDRKEWYKGIISDEELEALEFPRPKNRTTEYRNQASRRKGASSRPLLED
ncbi:hypothetical protein J6590_010653 [Homalodisca vitripennis]|nr:hypothetical protein J6590_010653 [Homalodisca vitripennis]